MGGRRDGPLWQAGYGPYRGPIRGGGWGGGGMRGGGGNWGPGGDMRRGGEHWGPGGGERGWAGGERRWGGGERRWRGGDNRMAYDPPPRECRRVMQHDDRTDRVKTTCPT